MPKQPMPFLFTIGCSVHDSETFVSLLQGNGIQVIVDVRSVPYSGRTPQFNRETIQRTLTQHKIIYLYMGAEFGARREEPNVYAKGQVRFEKVFKLSIFKQGVERIKDGLAKDYRIALMCTEKDPIDCHRTIMVTRYLCEHLQLSVNHIHFDGKLETNERFEQRLLQTTGTEPDLFVQDETSLIKTAYQKIENHIAYKGEKEEDEEPVCQN